MALRNGCLLIAAVLAAIFLFIPKQPSTDSSESNSRSADGDTTSNSLRAENLGAKIEIVDVQSTWAPAKGSQRGPNLCWIQPTIRNNGNVPVRLVWARVEGFTRDGRGVFDEEDIIYYADDLPGQPSIGPGQTYAGDPYEVGDPWFPMLGGVPLTDEPLTFRVTVTAAYERTNVNKDGSPAPF